MTRITFRAAFLTEFECNTQEFILVTNGVQKKYIHIVNFDIVMP